MSVTFSGQCLICGNMGTITKGSKGDTLNCPRCGPYECTPSVRAQLKALGKLPANWVAISHAVRTKRPPQITTYYFDEVLKTAEEPDPVAAADNLIAWVGSVAKLGASTSPAMIELAAQVGT